MAREGVQPHKKSKTRTLKGPTFNSQRSIKRNSRHFVSLEKDSRKHRRAAKRSIQKRTQYGKLHEPGTKVDNGAGTFVHTAGGSIKYH